MLTTYWFLALNIVIYISANKVYVMLCMPNVAKKLMFCSTLITKCLLICLKLQSGSIMWYQWNRLLRFVNGNGQLAIPINKLSKCKGVN